MSGNVTVESAYIIPIVLVIICAFIYVIFAVHDRGVIDIMGDMALEELSVCDNTDEYTVYGNTAGEVTEALKIRIKDNLKGKLMIYDIENIAISKKDSVCNVDIQTDMKISIPVISSLMSGFLEYGYSNKQTKYDYCTGVRALELAND